MTNPSSPVGLKINTHFPAAQIQPQTLSNSTPSPAKESTPRSTTATRTSTSPVLVPRQNSTGTSPIHKSPEKEDSIFEPSPISTASPFAAVMLNAPAPIKRFGTVEPKNPSGLLGKDEFKTAMPSQKIKLAIETALQSESPSKLENLFKQGVRREHVALVGWDKLEALPATIGMFVHEKRDTDGLRDDFIRLAKRLTQFLAHPEFKPSLIHDQNHFVAGLPDGPSNEPSAIAFRQKMKALGETLDEFTASRGVRTALTETLTATEPTAQNEENHIEHGWSQLAALDLIKQVPAHDLEGLRESQRYNVGTEVAIVDLFKNAVFGEAPVGPMGSPAKLPE